MNLTSLVFPLYWDKTSWGKSGVGDFSLPRTMRVPELDGYLKSISITIYHQVGHDIHQNMLHNGKIFLHQTDYICCQKNCDFFPFVLKLWNCLKMPFITLLFGILSNGFYLNFMFFIPFTFPFFIRSKMLPKVWITMQRGKKVCMFPLTVAVVKFDS